MRNPKIWNLIELGLAFLCKASYEFSCSHTSCIPDKPTLITEAEWECCQQVLDVRFEGIFLLGSDQREFRSYLSDTVTGSLAIWLVFGHTLLVVKLANLLCVFYEILFTVFSKKKFPSLIRILANTCSNIVPIQAHSWYEWWVVHSKEFCISFCCLVQSSGTGWRR